jgi:AcrR family transcriptional regulator
LILEAAFEAFAKEGLAVPIDEIARRAGVGAGTVYRHFPAKEDLFKAVISDRMQRLVEKGTELLKSEAPGEALFAFVRLVVLEWGSNRGIADTLAGVDIDVSDLDDELQTATEGLLEAAQRAGTVRPDVTAAEVKALIVACMSVHPHETELVGRVTEIVLDGLRRR